MRQETIRIEGMSCMHCVHAVRQALGKIEGLEVDNVAIGEAVVRYDDQKVDRKTIVAAIEEEGYTAA